MNWTLQLFFFLESINAFDIKKEEKKHTKWNSIYQRKQKKMYMMNVGFPIINKL